jgi:hypothetical protein
VRPSVRSGVDDAPLVRRSIAVAPDRKEFLAIPESFGLAEPFVVAKFLGISVAQRLRTSADRDRIRSCGDACRTSQ